MRRHTLWHAKSSCGEKEEQRARDKARWAAEQKAQEERARAALMATEEVHPPTAGKEGERGGCTAGDESQEGSNGRRGGGGANTLRGFATGSFDRVLLDPPCSALGLRPKLLQTSVPRGSSPSAHRPRTSGSSSGSQCVCYVWAAHSSTRLVPSRPRRTRSRSRPHCAAFHASGSCRRCRSWDTTAGLVWDWTTHSGGWCNGSSRRCRGAKASSSPSSQRCPATTCTPSKLPKC